MHRIEPFFAWRDDYSAETDEQSPFFEREYSEFEYSNKIYNYYIHPQWDEFGSPTLYVKLLFVDYDKAFAILELFGEWNDAVQNDIMFLKREVIDPLTEAGIAKWVLIGENVLNFHAGDDDYYAEWLEEASENGGWICGFNFLQHVREEMAQFRLYDYIAFDEPFAEVNWRRHRPVHIIDLTEKMLRLQARIS